MDEKEIFINIAFKTICNVYSVHRLSFYYITRVFKYLFIGLKITVLKSVAYVFLFLSRMLAKIRRTPARSLVLKT